MSHECPEPTDLAALLALPGDDPRRRAAAACPRCDALMRSLSAFLAGDDSIPGDERRAAERRLEGVVAGLAGGREAAPAGGANGGARAATRARMRLVPGARGWGWTAGLAAAAAAFVLLVAGDDPAGPGADGGRLRGANREGASVIELKVTAGTDAGLRIDWAEVAGADRYRLEVFAADLDTLAVQDRLSRPHAELPAGVAGAGDGAMCRVRAYRGAEEVAASGLVEVEAP